MAKARLETTLTGDESPFIQAVNRAEKRAQGFQGRIQTLFRRDPSARAQRALGGFVGDLASGDVGTAISSIATRLHGVGLAAGIGIGAAVIIFQKAKEQLEAVDKAVLKVNQDLSRPLSLQRSLGVEGISKEIEEAGKNLDDLKEKRTGFFQKIREAGTRGQPDAGYFDPNTRKWVDENVDRVPAAARAQSAEETRLRALSRARAEAELRVVAIRRTGLDDSEREGALQENALKAEEKRAKLYLDRGLTKPGRSAEDLFRSVAAVNQDETLSRQEIAKKFDLKKQEEEVENRILNLHASTLTKEQQSMAALRERINLLKQRLAGPGSVEQKTTWGTQLHGLENQELGAQYAESRKPWSQKAAEQNAQLDYRSWVRSQTPSNPNAYISHPDAYNRRDILGNRVDPRGNVMMPTGDNSDKGQGDVVGAIKSLEQKLTDIWTK